MEYITQTAGPKVELRHKFNEALVQQVREGKLAIENTDEAKTIALIAYIFPSDVSTLGLTNFYWASTPNCWTSDKYTSIPSRPVSDFFLPAQPLRIEDVTDKQVIHCETEEQMNALFKVLDEAGFTWNTGKSYTGTPASWYKEGFCINPTRGTHATLCFYSEIGYEILPASLFLQPLTEKEGKERTYKVTREQLKELYPQTHSLEEREFIITMADMLGVLESQKEFSEKNVIDFVSEKMPVRLLALIFPEFNHSPIVPKGEFAWVRDAEDEEWRCRLSAGDGKFYPGQQETPFTNSWKEVRKYEDRPF